MTAQAMILVTSHVGRDLLQSAALFKNESAVVWEYVVNGLQYVDPGVTPRVLVEIDNANHQIRISDNGRGMTAVGLRDFFRMHGENADRRAGRPGRGKFGTGKSAAFGIANELIVDTVRGGKRNVLKLTRDMIQTSSGEEIPLQWLVNEEDTDEGNGTTITIAEVNLSKIKKAPVIEYIERHLQQFRATRAEVAVDEHVCVARQPQIAREYEFEPTPEQRNFLGDTKLVIYVAQAPLQPIDQGVAITCGPGNLVAMEGCGVTSKEMGNYLFGEIDVPALEEYDSPIEPFDASRRLELNLQHPVVQRLVGFLGAKLDEVRIQLVREAREASREEQARRLAEEGDRIAQILNEDFRSVSDRLNTIKAASTRRGAALGTGPVEKLGTGTADGWVRGIQAAGKVEKGETGLDQRSAGKGGLPPRVRAAAERDDAGQDFVDPIGSEEGKRQRPRAGFRVEYKNLGAESDRSIYDTTTLTILINLDHPVVGAALRGASVDDPSFRRLSYEIAFSEYAMGLGVEISRQDPDIPADDLLYEVRTTLNRVFSNALSLYRN